MNVHRHKNKNKNKKGNSAHREIPFGVSMTKQIVLIGDSIVGWGYKTGWVTSLSAAFTGSANIINAGFGGYNTRWILENLESDDPCVPACRRRGNKGGSANDCGSRSSSGSSSCQSIIDGVINSSSQEAPLLVAICLGANDAADPETNHEHVPLEEYETKLTAIVSWVKTNLQPEKGVLILTPTPPSEEHWARYWAEECAMSTTCTSPAPCDTPQRVEAAVKSEDEEEQERGGGLLVVVDGGGIVIVPPTSTSDDTDSAQPPLDVIKSDRTVRRTRTYRDAALRVANATGAHSVDLFSALGVAEGDDAVGTWADCFLDGLHLNPKGDQLVFEAVVAAMSDMGVAPETRATTEGDLPKPIEEMALSYSVKSSGPRVDDEPRCNNREKLGSTLVLRQPRPYYTRAKRIVLIGDEFTQRGFRGATIANVFESLRQARKERGRYGGGIAQALEVEIEQPTRSKIALGRGVEGWVGKLATAYMRTCHVANAALAGSTTESVWRGLYFSGDPYVLRVAGDGILTGRPPPLVTIWLGHHDFINGVSATAFSENLFEIAKWCVTQLKAANLVLIAPLLRVENTGIGGRLNITTDGAAKREDEKKKNNVRLYNKAMEETVARLKSFIASLPNASTRVKLVALQCGTPQVSNDAVDEENIEMEQNIKEEEEEEEDTKGKVSGSKLEEDVHVGGSKDNDCVDADDTLVNSLTDFVDPLELSWEMPNYMTLSR